VSLLYARYTRPSQYLPSIIAPLTFYITTAHQPPILHPPSSCRCCGLTTAASEMLATALLPYELPSLGPWFRTNCGTHRTHTYIPMECNSGGHHVYICTPLIQYGCVFRNHRYCLYLSNRLADRIPPRGTLSLRFFWLSKLSFNFEAMKMPEM
jgi:hypothetical protein